ncbi:AmmeMemoRadiSam system radical SAM enzyme [bacterium]
MKQVLILVVFLIISLFSNFLLSNEVDHDKISKARYYERIDKDTVQCVLCPFKCILGPGDLGWCKARKNIDGELYSLSYGNLCAVHVDPIEKKPFFHYLPGTTSFSIASGGCNLRCKFCQNWQISQVGPFDVISTKYTPNQVATLAKKMGCASVAYTYSEPTNFYEFMYDTSIEVDKIGLKNVYHSNGYINQEPLLELCKYLDAANIDLKGFTEEYYQKISEASLAPVLETLKTLVKQGVWLEITTLVVPGLNDDLGTMDKMFKWIKENLGQNVPIHLSRFYPTYKLKNAPPTSLKSLQDIRKIALKNGLNYVYIGNMPGIEEEDTFCPNCKNKIIDRRGYVILQKSIDDNGKCLFCSYDIKGIWKLN